MVGVLLGDEVKVGVEVGVLLGNGVLVGDSVFVGVGVFVLVGNGVLLAVEVGSGGSFVFLIT